MTAQQADPAGLSAHTEGDLAGTLVAGRYRVVKKLGEGGMGAVYHAVHEALRKPVALKLLTGRSSADKETVARFEREAVAAANLRHPNIAEATDFGRLPDGAFYLVMEYIEGKTLRALLDAQPAGLPPGRLLPILKQVAAALACAHAADIVHRDLKPENVLVTDRPNQKDSVKVIDFGIARIRSAAFGGGAALTVQGAVFGTPEYMSPEQVLGQPADTRADQYAFGVMAFELLTGRVPFTGAELGQILAKHVSASIPLANEWAPHLPRTVGVALSRMLAKQAGERFPTILDAYQALEAAASPPPASGTIRIDPQAQNAAAPSPAVTGGPYSPAVTGGPYSPAATGGPGSPAATGGPYSPAATGGPYSGGLSPASPLASAATPPITHPVGAVTGPLGTRPLAAQPPAPVAEAYAPPANEPPAPARGGLQQGKAAKSPLVWILASGGAGLLVLLVIVVIWAASGSSLPDNVESALDLWEDGSFEEAEAPLREALTKTPAIAAEPGLHKPLVAKIDDDRARTVLLRLLNTTQLGRTAPLAEKLAAIGLDEAESPRRNGALRLLRGRHDLLPIPVRARIALRDADDCVALDKAVSSLRGAGSEAESDETRYRAGECKKLLRRPELCGCPPKGSGKIRGPKGRGL